MEKTLIAKTQGGREITCKVLIDETGNIETEYPIAFAKNEKMGLRGYSIELTKEQAEKMSGRKCPVDKVNVFLENGSEWPALKTQAEKIKNTRDWSEMLKKNEKLELWNASTSGGNVIIGLPEILKDKEAMLLKILDFSWDIEQDKFLLDITAKELLAVIEKGKIEKKEAKEKAAAKKIELMKKARETGQPQIIYQGSLECDTPDIDCDIDNIVGYIRADGSQFEERHHCY